MKRYEEFIELMFVFAFLIMLFGSTALLLSLAMHVLFIV